MTFKIAAWNIRGLNGPSKHRELKNFVVKEEIKVTGILETKIKAVIEKKIFSSCLKNWSFLSNSQPNETGRICVSWDSNFCMVNQLSASDQHIFCEITDLTQASSFLACFVYADNNYSVRRVFCETMVRLSHSQSNCPIAFLGDFNATRYSHEKFGGSQIWNSLKEEFNSYILASELDDLSYTGCQFTWANKRDCGEYIATKIDRVLVNESWLDKFPNSTAIFLPSTISDHSPAVVTVSDAVTSYKKPF